LNIGPGETCWGGEKKKISRDSLPLFSTHTNPPNGNPRARPRGWLDPLRLEENKPKKKKKKLVEFFRPTAPPTVAVGQSKRARHAPRKPPQKIPMFNQPKATGAPASLRPDGFPHPPKGPDLHKSPPDPSSIGTKAFFPRPSKAGFTNFKKKMGGVGTPGTENRGGKKKLPNIDLAPTPTLHSPNCIGPVWGRGKKVGVFVQ